MFHQKIKTLFQSAVCQVSSNISQFTLHPEKDLIRNKKLPPDKLISFLVSEGSSSTKNELLDFFD
ncbi:MAG: IS4/IS5 family transposase, partial [Lachnotalea sp.]